MTDANTMQNDTTEKIKTYLLYLNPQNQDVKKRAKSNNINIIGINTDKKIRDYLSYSNIDVHNLLKIKEKTNRDFLKYKTGIDKLPFDKNKFNLFVGGLGKLHHISLGIIDTFYSEQKFDVISISHYSDNCLYKNPGLVWCGNYLWHLQNDGKTFLHIHKKQNDRTLYTLFEDYMRYKSDDSSFIPNPSEKSNSLRERLSLINPKVYLIIDCDALEKKDPNLYKKSFKACKNHLNKGGMPLDDMLKTTGIIFNEKEVVGASLWGYEKGNGSVYDAIIGKITTSLLNKKEVISVVDNQNNYLLDGVHSVSSKN